MAFVYPHHYWFGADDRSLLRGDREARRSRPDRRSACACRGNIRKGVPGRLDLGVEGSPRPVRGRAALLSVQRIERAPRHLDEDHLVHHVRLGLPGGARDPVRSVIEPARMGYAIVWGRQSGAVSTAQARTPNRRFPARSRGDLVRRYLARFSFGSLRMSTRRCGERFRRPRPADLQHPSSLVGPPQSVAQL